MDPWVKRLSPELIEKARVELNEIQDQVPDEIQKLRETIGKDPELNFRTDNTFLLRFLRARKFNQERALELLKNYYKQRLNYPKLYEKLSTSRLSEALASNYQGVLFDRDSQGRAILVFNSLSHWDPNKFSLEDLTANFLLNLEHLIEEDEIQINGIICIIDVNGLSLNHFPHVTPWALKQFFNVTLNAFPARYKQIHYINEYQIFDALFLLFKPFLSEKVKSRILFHGSKLESLHKHISPSILPEEFGGNKGPYDNREWNRVLAQNDENMEQNKSYGFVQKPV